MLEGGRIFFFCLFPLKTTHPLKVSSMPGGLLEKDLGSLEVHILCETVEWCARPSFPPGSSEAPVCDVHTPSCPPLSFHLHHSHPTPFLRLPMLLQPTPLPLSINLPLPSTSPPLSVCLFHPLILPSFCQKPYFHTHPFHSSPTL